MSMSSSKVSPMNVSMVDRRRYYRSDAMDEYLGKLGCVRNSLPKDPSSLFRAVSEQVYGTQRHYGEIESLCIRYLYDNNLVNGEDLSEASNKTRSCIQALSSLFKRDFVIYRELGKSPTNDTGSRFSKKVFLCESFRSHFDSVYNRNYRERLGICQAIVYEILYRNVFRVTKNELDESVALVRGSRGGNRCPIREFPRRNSVGEPFMNMNGGESDMESGPELARSLQSRYGRKNLHPPFPWKVAKALDPHLYRVVEYDCWLLEKKELFLRQEAATRSLPCAPGTRCEVKLEAEGETYSAIVQKPASEPNHAMVFIPKLGDVRKVAFGNMMVLNKDSRSTESSPRSGGSDRNPRSLDSPPGSSIENSQKSSPRFRFRKTQRKLFDEGGVRQRVMSEGSPAGMMKGMGGSVGGMYGVEGERLSRHDTVPLVVVHPSEHHYSPSLPSAPNMMTPPVLLTPQISSDMPIGVTHSQDGLVQYVQFSHHHNSPLPYNPPQHHHQFLSHNGSPIKGPRGESWMDGELSGLFGYSTTPENSSGYAEFMSSGEQQTDMNGDNSGGMKSGGTAPRPIPTGRSNIIPPHAMNMGPPFVRFPTVHTTTPPHEAPIPPMISTSQHHLGPGRNLGSLGYGSGGIPLYSTPAHPSMMGPHPMLPCYSLEFGSIDFSAIPSKDLRGNDLPADVNTLRYFYNLGCDYFQQCMAQQQMSGYPNHYGPPAVSMMTVPNQYGLPVEPAILQPTPPPMEAGQMDFHGVSEVTDSMMAGNEAQLQR